MAADHGYAGEGFDEPGEAAALTLVAWGVGRRQLAEEVDNGVRQEILVTLNMMGQRLRPMTRAASTYSLFFSPSTEARTVLA